MVLVGLAAKNAILIVEFAKQAEEEGKSRFEAAELAAHTRLRPIVMTSLAFILGVVPLMIAAGRGRGNAAIAGDGGLRRYARRDALWACFLRRSFTSGAASGDREAGAERGDCPAYRSGGAGTRLPLQFRKRGRSQGSAARGLRCSSDPVIWPTTSAFRRTTTIRLGS